MDLSVELKALCTILLMEDDKVQICEEISEYLVGEREKEAFVFWLLKTWSFSSIKDYRCFGMLMSKKLNATDVCTVVNKLELQERFVRGLLFLPELKKQPLIKSLCQEISTNRNENLQLSHDLFKIAFSEYCHNVMVSCSYQFDARTVELFSENIKCILRCMREFEEDFPRLSIPLMNCLDSLLIDTVKPDNVLMDLDKYSLGRYTASDISQAQQYLQQLKQELTSSRQRLGNWQVWTQLWSSSSWIEMIGDVLQTCKISLRKCQAEKFSLKECQLENLQEAFSISLAMKLKTLLSILGEDRKEMQGDVCECLRLVKQLSADSDLLSFICGEATVDEINDIKTTCPDNNLYREVWNSLDTTSTQKITLGLNIITNLYSGHEEVFKWMLNYRNMPDQFSEALAQVAVSYIVNYGTVIEVANVINCIVDKGSCNFKNYKENLEKIVQQLLPSLHIRQVNELIFLCREYHTQHQTFLYSDSNPFNREDFQKELNEIFNKITESSLDTSDVVEMDRLQRLAILCLRSPFYVLNELLTRIFDGHLKSSIAAKVLHFLPVLSSINFLGEHKENLTLFSLAKSKFLSQHDKLASEENLADILVYMSKCGDKTNQENITTTIIDEIVYPNLCDPQYGDLRFTTTIRILKELQSGNCISMSQTILLLEVLFCYLKPSVEDEIPMGVLQCFEELSNIVHQFVNIIRMYYERVERLAEKNGIVNVVKQLLEDNDWTASCYFRPLFNCISQAERLKIPKCFVDKFGTREEEFEAIVDSSYQDEYGCWLVLFELYIINEKLTEPYIDNFLTINIDEDFDGFVAAIIKLFTVGGVNKFKAFKIYGCLVNLVKKGKFQGIDSFAPEQLNAVTDCHGHCLCVALTLEIFKLMFSSVDVEQMTDKESFNIQSFPKLLDFFNKFMKDMENFSNLCCFGLFFLEATLETISSFQHPAISQNFLLLLLDTLVIIDKSCRTLPQDEQISILTECKRIVESYNKDSTLMALKEKAEGMAAKL